MIEPETDFTFGEEIISKKCLNDNANISNYCNLIIHEF